MPDPITESMKLDQIERVREEHARAKAASDPAAEESHERRADKADYLREKLAERARAEDEAAATDDD
ncbi:MAG: hypothetical protein QOE28_1551 [Solirubrobacteraceae bacterium]|jgi:hypothetical protein|nr:hypothetical protein [Solirubrobacteraceae bacterium]